LQENTWDAVIGTDLDFKIRSWNKAAERIYGWRYDEVLGQRAGTVLKMEFSTETNIEESIKELYATGHWYGEVVQYRKDGSPINIFGSIVLIKDKNGKAIGSMGVNHDITERKRMEAVLRDSEAELRGVFATMDDRITIVNKEGNVIKVVTTNPDPFFLAQEELVGKNVAEIFEPNEAALAKKAIKQALETQQKVEVETAVQRNNQSYWISFRVVPLTLDTCIAFSRNITPRKQVEEALGKTNDQLRAILDNSSAVIYLTDANHRFLTINRQYETLFGVKREEIVGKAISAIFPEEIAKEYEKNDQLVLDTRTTIQFEEIGLLADEQHTYLSVKSPLFDNNGVPYAVCGVSTDITERKRWEETLRKSEALLAEAQRIAKLGSWEINLQTGETIWSEETLRIVGGVNDDIVNLKDYLNKLIHPEDKVTLQQQLGKTITEGIPFETEYRLLNQAGISSYIFGRTQPIVENGEVTKLFGTIQDITERKQTEAALKRSEADLRAVFDSTPFGFILIDKDIRVRLANRVATNNIRKYYQNQILPGKTYKEIIPEIELQETFLKYFNEALAGDLTVSELIETADKQKNYFERRYYPVITDDGDTIGVCVTTENITERRLADQTLRENEARLQILFEYSPSPLCVWDKSGVIFDTNRAYEELSGYSRQELFGEHFSLAIPLDPLQLDKDLESILNNGQNIEYDLEIIRKDGMPLIVEARIFPIKMRGEDYILASVHDITRRKEVEQDLRQAFEKQKELSELKSRFVSTASHEFRTPLATIQAASDALKEYMEKMSPEQVRRRIDKIQSQVRHMIVLLEDVLTIEQVQTEKTLF